MRLLSVRSMSVILAAFPAFCCSTEATLADVAPQTDILPSATWVSTSAFDALEEDEEALAAPPLLGFPLAGFPL
eukprot:COSAG05_NODE_17656_length_321_cov_1.603604_1_plen_73_part_10